MSDKRLTRWSEAGYGRVLMFGKWWDIRARRDRETVIHVDQKGRRVMVEHRSFNCTTNKN
jgi:hypothetical protein